MGTLTPYLCKPDVANVFEDTGLCYPETNFWTTADNGDSSVDLKVVSEGPYVFYMIRTIKKLSNE